jgi:hypothetical protein
VQCSVILLIGNLPGDVVFQPCKVEHAGLSDAVDGRVLIYIRLKEAFDNVERRYPARQHGLDELRILIAVKQFWAARNDRVPARGKLSSDHESGQRLRA